MLGGSISPVPPSQLRAPSRLIARRFARGRVDNAPADAHISLAEDRRRPSRLQPTFREAGDPHDRPRPRRPHHPDRAPTTTRKGDVMLAPAQSPRTLPPIEPPPGVEVEAELRA